MKASLVGFLALGALTCWFLLLAVTFCTSNPGLPIPAEVILLYSRSLIAALIALLACLGAGAALLQRLDPPALDDDLGWVRALVLGMGAWGLLSLFVALLGGLGTSWAGPLLILVLAACWLNNPPLRPPRIPGHIVLLVSLALLPGLLTMLAPATDTDELYYHLALPGQLLELGNLVGGPLYPNGSRPLAIHLPWAWLMQLGGEAAPRAFHLLCAGALALALHQRAREWWGGRSAILALAMLAGSTTFSGETGLAYDDIPASLAVLVTFDLWVSRRRPILLGLGAGCALAMKYTSALVLLPMALLILSSSAWSSFKAAGGGRSPRTGTGSAGAISPRGILTSLAACLLLVSPWWLRNIAEGLHPLFPFTGWNDAGVSFQLPEKYGMGRGALDFLLLPWNMVMHAETDNHVFLGRINPAFLGLLPVGIWAARRDERARWAASVTIPGLAIWAVGTQWLRYLLPLLPVWALLAAAGTRRMGRALHLLTWVLLLSGLPANLAPIASMVAAKAPASLGQETHEEYLSRTMPAWPALRWINQETTQDASVALLFAWQAYPLQRKWILGSVEDHVPTRHFLRLHGQQSLNELKALGVDFVLLQRIRFLEKTYSFLPEQQFREQFLQPETLLDRLLLQQAELVFQEGRFSVWRL